MLPILRQAQDEVGECRAPNPHAELVEAWATGTTEKETPPIVDHISLTVRDLAAAAAFYDAVLAPLGYARLAERPRTVGFGKRYP
ncbi:MAG: hypothetical protein VW405_20125 [Rhodospirillaceae bacterium]